MQGTPTPAWLSVGFLLPSRPPLAGQPCDSALRGTPSLEQRQRPPRAAAWVGRGPLRRLPSLPEGQDWAGSHGLRQRFSSPSAPTCERHPPPATPVADSRSQQVSAKAHRPCITCVTRAAHPGFRQAPL